MPKKIFTAAIFITVIFFGAGCISTKPNSPTTSPAASVHVASSTAQSNPSDILIFVSSTCQHCANVENAIHDGRWDKELSIRIIRIDSAVFDFNYLSEKSRGCGLASDTPEVPLLVQGKTCVQGDQKIIDYVKKQFTCFLYKDCL